MHEFIEAMHFEHNWPYGQQQNTNDVAFTALKCPHYLHFLAGCGAICMFAGSAWQRQAKKAVYSSLQLRYGLLTQAQAQNALQKAMHNSSSKYKKVMIHGN